MPKDNNWIPEEFATIEEYYESEKDRQKENHKRIPNQHNTIAQLHTCIHKQSMAIHQLTKLFGDKLTEQGKDIQLLRAHLNRVNNAVIKLNTKFEDLELSDDSDEPDHGSRW